MARGSKKLLRLEAGLSLQLVAFVATVALCLGYAYVVLQNANEAFERSRRHTESTLTKMERAINELHPLRIAMVDLRNNADEFTHRFHLLTLDPDYDAEQIAPTYRLLIRDREQLVRYQPFWPDTQGDRVLENLEILLDIADELLISTSPNIRQQLFNDTIQPMNQIDQAISLLVELLAEREAALRQQLVAGASRTEQAQAEFQRHVGRLQQVFVTIVVVIIVLPVMIQYLFFRNLRQRLTMLEQYADAIAREDYSLPPFRSADSAGRLGLRLALMGRRTRRLLRLSRAQRARADQALVEVENLAYFDPLTGLENRRRFYEHLVDAIALYAEGGQEIAVLFIDLDNFKLINDSMGHVVGDELLKVVAERLMGEVRARDNLARLGGDEFAILAYHQKDQGQHLLERIQYGVTQPIYIDEHEIFVTISTGITLIDDSTATPDDLLRRADMAMYQAKSSGRNTFHHFDHGLQQQVDEQLSISQELRTAIRERQFELHYQPQYSLIDGQMNGAEALIRWTHPQQGMMRPDLFIPVAEKTGIITQIDEWVVDTACEAAARFCERRQPLRISINVSPNQFHNPEFVPMVEAALRRRQLLPELLEIEITEGILLRDFSHAVAIINRLKALGIKIALDDFGTGYSSLSYLRQLPLDVLKIDRSFILHMHEFQRDQAIVKTIIDLGQHLGLEVIAEGIETEADMRFLRDNGCDTGQGFYFCRPMPQAELLALEVAGDAKSVAQLD